MCLCLCCHALFFHIFFVAWVCIWQKKRAIPKTGTARRLLSLHRLRARGGYLFRVIAPQPQRPVRSCGDGWAATPEWQPILPFARRPTYLPHHHDDNGRPAHPPTYPQRPLTLLPGEPPSFVSVVRASFPQSPHRTSFWNSFVLPRPAPVSVLSFLARPFCTSCSAQQCAL